MRGGGFLKVPFSRADVEAAAPRASEAATPTGVAAAHIRASLPRSLSYTFTSAYIIHTSKHPRTRPSLLHSPERAETRAEAERENERERETHSVHSRTPGELSTPSGAPANHEQGSQRPCASEYGARARSGQAHPTTARRKEEAESLRSASLSLSLLPYPSSSARRKKPRRGQA